MTSANVSDEPIAYLDEEAFARLGGIADLFLVHDRPIETRTDDSVLRAARPSPCPAADPSLAGIRAREPRTAPSRRAAGAGVRRRAEEHVLRGQGRAERGSRTTSATWRTTRRCGASSTGIGHFERLFAVRAGDRGTRPPSRVPLEQVRRRPRRCRAGGRPAPSRPPGGLPGRARGGGAGCGGHLRWHRIRDRRNRVGRRAPDWRAGRVPARRSSLAGPAAGRRARRARALADGLRLAGRRARGGGGAAGCARRGRSTGGRGGRSPSWRSAAWPRR